MILHLADSGVIKTGLTVLFTANSSVAYLVLLLFSDKGGVGMQGAPWLLSGVRAGLGCSV